MKLAKPSDEIAEFCGRHPIRKLALFGSAPRADFRPESDIDVLVEFEPGARVGLIRLAGMEHTPGGDGARTERDFGTQGGSQYAALPESPLSRAGGRGGANAA